MLIHVVQIKKSQQSPSKSVATVARNQSYILNVLYIQYV